MFYRSQKLAWMDTYKFREWFICEFVPKVKKHLSAFKLPAKHFSFRTKRQPTGRTFNVLLRVIKMIFLQPNVTTLQQPMDLEKVLPKASFCSFSKLEKDKNTDPITAIKSVNMKNVIYIPEGKATLGERQLFIWQPLKGFSQREASAVDVVFIKK